MTARTDRELLELAAKAHGYIDDATDEINANGLHKGKDGVFYVVEETGWSQWGPYRDDGDALRLSSQLLMQIIQDSYGFVKVGFSAGVDSGAPTADGCGPWYWRERLIDHGGDRNAATRRAIVLVAAAIGEAMP